MSNAPQFQFVGSSDKAVREKISWPIEAQAIVIRNNVVEGLGAQAAFASGVAEFNELVDAGEIQGERMPDALPPSYTNKNAGSVLYGLKQRFLKRINDPSARGHAETLEAAQRFGVVQPAGEVEETITSEDVGSLEDALETDNDE